MAEVGAHDITGVDSGISGIRPVPAGRGLLEKTGTTIEDYDLVN